MAFDDTVLRGAPAPPTDATWKASRDPVGYPVPVDKKDPTAPFYAAWVKQESGGNPRALNKKSGARGLLQILPSTARDYGITDPDLLYIPTVNIALGKRILADYTKKYNGNTTLGLMAYNDGPGNIDKWLAGERLLPEETKRYAVNILKGGQAAMQIPSNMQDPLMRNLPYAKPGPDGGYITQLNPKEKAAFEQWVAKNKVPTESTTPYSPNADYDLPGYWRDLASKGKSASGVDPNDEQVHMTDKYKTPYSTEGFSNESRYSTPDNPFRWKGETQIDTRTGQPVYEVPKKAPQAPPAPQQSGILQALDPARWTGFEGTAQAAEVDPMAGAVRVGDVGGMIPDSHPIKVAESGDPMAGAVRVGDVKAPELPLAVKIGDWLPTIGQFGGEACSRYSGRTRGSRNGSVSADNRTARACRGNGHGGRFSGSWGWRGCGRHGSAKGG